MWSDEVPPANKKKEQEITGGIRARPQNIPTYPNWVPSMKTKRKNKAKIKDRRYYVTNSSARQLNRI